MNSEDNHHKTELHQDDGEANRRLLSNSEFADLMISEYNRHPGIKDELAAERIWKKIEPSMKAPKSPSLKIGLATLLVASLVAVIYRQETPSPEDLGSLREKGVSGYPVGLDTYLVLADGSLRTIDATQLTPGMTITFKTKIVSTGTKKLAIALTGKIGDEPVRFLTPGQALAPGDASYLEKDGKAFGYQITDQDKHLTFCIFTAGSLDELTNMREHLEDTWRERKSGPCQEFSIR